MLEGSADDLKTLGLLFLRLLEADFRVLSNQPSAVLAIVLALEQQGALVLSKELTALFSELRATGIPMVTDGFGNSILRT